MELLENAVYLLTAAAELTAEGSNFNVCHEELTGLLNRVYKKIPNLEIDTEIIDMFKKSLAADVFSAGTVNTAIIMLRFVLQ